MLYPVAVIKSQRANPERIGLGLFQMDISEVPMKIDLDVVRRQLQVGGE